MRLLRNPILWIVLYCLVHLAIRLSISNSLDWDEAEQFINSATLNLGDGQQPPLYSWITWGLRSAFGEHLWVFAAPRYIFLAVFLIFSYLSIREFYEKNSLLVFSSLAWVLIYAYTINWKLTHTVLVFALAAISFYLFWKLFDKPSLVNYSLLGLALGLGFVAKYNFAFFALALGLATISTAAGRKVILDAKAWISIMLVTVIAGPHYLKLFNSGLLYAAERAGSHSTSILKITQALALVHLELVLPLLLIYICFHKWINVAPSTNTKIQTLRLFSLYSLVLPLIAIIYLKAAKFPSPWLGVAYFGVLMGIFSFIDLERVSSLNKKIYFGLSILITVIFFSIKCITFYTPDTFKKIQTINYPWAQMAKVLENSFDKKDTVIVFSDYQLVTANLDYQIKNPNWTFISVETLDGIDMTAGAGKTKVILISDRPHQYWIQMSGKCDFSKKNYDLYLRDL